MYENMWPLKLSDFILCGLDHLGIKYEVSSVEGANDMTESFKDNFQQPRHKYLLDFVTHTKMDRYPPVVAQTCIDYLSSVAQGKPEQYKVPRMTFIISCLA